MSKTNPVPNYRKGAEDPAQLPITPLRVNYVIGIDPDKDRSGLAVWCRPKRCLTFVDAVPAHKLIANLSKIEVGTTLFRVDGGWLNKNFHHEKALPEGFKDWNVQSKLDYYFAIGVKVGTNFGVGHFITDWLTATHGEDLVKVIRPQGKNPKWNDADMKRFTGWKFPTNPDSRDAAKLCFQF